MDKIFNQVPHFLCFKEEEKVLYRGTEYKVTTCINNVVNPELRYGYNDLTLSFGDYFRKPISVCRRHLQSNISGDHGNSLTQEVIETYEGVN